MLTVEKNSLLRSSLRDKLVIASGCGLMVYHDRASRGRGVNDEKTPAIAHDSGGIGIVRRTACSAVAPGILGRVLHGAVTVQFAHRRAPAYATRCQQRRVRDTVCIGMQNRAVRGRFSSATPSSRLTASAQTRARIFCAGPFLDRANPPADNFR